MVYNRKHPTEQYRVSLKLTSGALRTFFLSPGSKNAHAFSTLENKITTFLQVSDQEILSWVTFGNGTATLMLGQKGGNAM